MVKVSAARAVEPVVGTGTYDVEKLPNSYIAPNKDTASAVVPVNEIAPAVVNVLPVAAGAMPITGEVVVVAMLETSVSLNHPPPIFSCFVE
jgi:hypothetical protein